MGSRYESSFSGLGELLRSDMVAAAMAGYARRVRAHAEAIAPVDTDGDDAHRGRYKASFDDSVQRLVRGRRWPAVRAVGVVRNTAPEALIVEYGNANTPEHATLRKALDAARD